jgi:dihydroxyacid dehydratase/phosphogluconate dehydratase
MDAKTTIKRKLPSRHATEGSERAPHRSYYYAIGLTTEEIHQPFVGVATCWNEAAPCNIALMRQAQAVKKGVAAAGAPAPYEIRDHFCMTVGEGIVELINRNIRPRDIVTREALENAAAVVAASAGSTNAALHLPAIAHECGIKFDLLDVADVFKRPPSLADLKPSGRYAAKDLFEAGGVPLLLKTPLDHGFLHGGCLTVRGRSMAENLKTVAWNKDQDVVYPANRPLLPTGGVVGSSDNLAPDGAIIEIDAEKGPLNVKLSKAELDKRARAFTAKASNFTSGYLWKYAQQVGPARDGAVTHPGAAAEKRCYADI